MNCCNHDCRQGRDCPNRKPRRLPRSLLLLGRPPHPDDWKHIHAEFDRALTSWTEEWATWWERKVLGVTRVV